MALKLNELIVTNAINASITGNAATATSASFATTATTAANGGVTSVSAGTGIGTSASTGAVTITNSSPNATHTGDVTGATALTIANDAVTTVKILNSNVTNAKLANSSLTIGSTAISLGGTVTTFAGLASVTSTTFVGALTGNATTATALTSMNISQFTNNSGYLTSAVTSAVAGTGISVSGATGAVTITNSGVTSLAGTTNRITVSGATGGVTLNLPQDIHTGASPTFAGLSLTSVSTTGATITNLTGAYQNTSVYDSAKTQSATPSRGIRAPASSIQFTDSYAIAPFYTYRSTGDWPVPYGIGWGTGGESSGIFQRYASNGSSFGDMIFYTGNDGYGAFSFRRHTWEGTAQLAAGSGELNTELFRVDWAGNLTMLGTLNGSANSATFYANNGSYGAWAINGTRNGWGGIEFANNGVSLMMGSDTVGFHQNTNNGWLFRVHQGIGFIYKGVWGGGTAATILDSSNAAYAWNMNQNVRTTDNVTFGTVTAALSGNATTATNANAVSFTEVELNAPVTVSGTWTSGNGSEWGEPKFGTSFNQFRYTDGDGPYVEYNIPANHHACFISQLQWDTGGYADCHGVQSDGDLVFLRRINTRQSVENSNHGNTIQHDGATVSFVGSGLGSFTKIRITNRGGRIHMTGIAFTRQIDDGYEGTGMVHPAQISHQGAGSGLNADLLDGYNPATANTTNTIVLRDGSGNFSAGTITAALSGNATTATSISGFGNPTTNSTANTIVYREGNGYITNNYFHTSGGGSERNASGMAYFAGFNSSDYYIRSYTAAAVATLISGQTMNINGSSTSCSGNAATATTTDNINGRAFSNRDSGNGVGQDSYTNNGIGYVTGVSLFSQTDGGMYASAYSTSWIHQIYGDFRTGQIAIRGKNNGTWQSWRTVLDSTNASYAWNMNQNVRTTDTCSFAGLTVSNTINGSVTGNAATATTATSAGCINSDTGNVGGNRLQYWQVSGNTTLNPDGEWYNAIRMGHGDPVTYYGNTLAIRMTGGNLGDIYTRTLTNGVTGSWNRFWHNNNDGAGSGLDADLVDGKGLAIAGTADTIVLRDASGHITGQYILGSYFNASAGNSENPTIGQIWTQNTTDNYLRKSTPAHFRSQVTDGSYPSLTGANASGTWSISVTGNAGTATSAVTAGSCTGNAGTATTLQTARNINGTSFNGSAAITTANWGTARTLTIGSTGKSVDGSAAITWSLAEIGAAATNQTMFVGTTSVAINRASAGQTLTGVNIDGNAGSADVATYARRVDGATRTSFTVGGNKDNYYPVIFNIGSGATALQYSEFVIERGGYEDPGYTFAGGNIFSTLNIRFSCKSSGWGYGATYENVEMHGYTTQMVANWQQMSEASKLIVWLRGATIYYFWNVVANTTLHDGNSGGTSLTLAQSPHYSYTYTSTQTVQTKALYGKYVNSSTGTSGIYVAGNVLAEGLFSGPGTGLTGTASSLSIGGNAGTATILQTARNINGTSFNGSAAITTATWGTARTLTIGSTGKSVDGSAAITWSLAEIGAAATNQTMFVGTTSVAINRASAAQTLTGVSIDGSAASCTGNAATATGQQSGVHFTLNTGGAGYGLVGQYNADLHQGLFAMGAAYTLGAGGTLANFYGVSWSYDYAGRQLNTGYNLQHCMAVANAGVVATVIGLGIWTNGLIRANGAISSAGTITAAAFSGPLTGNATTATNGFTSKPGWAGNTNLIQSLPNFNNSVPSGFYEYASATNSPSATWYNLINVRHSNTGNDHGFQLAMSYYDNNLWFRSYQGGTGANNGTFQSWAKTLSDQNYTDYTVTKTGTGASGTWSINVTGTAGSATSATTATTTTGNAGSVTYLPGRTDATAYPVLWGAAYTNAVGTIAYSCAAVNIQSSTGILSATSFSGAGTGLTGTAASLTAGAANSVAWTNVSGRPTAVSSFTNDSGYLTSVAIANGSVTLAKIENITAYTILGNSNASATATPAALSVATVATMLSGQTMNINGSSTSISGFNNPTTAASANTIAYRDGSGHITGNYIFGSYLNSTDNVDTGTITNIVAKFGDNYHRSATAAKVAAFITGQTMNINGSSTSCSGNAATATNVAASGITGQTGMWTSAARPGPYRLYRRDSDDDYSVQNYWTGVYWRLDGYYSNNTLHAGCSVSYADTAGTANALNTNNNYRVTNFGIDTAPSNKLHINGDNVNPTIRVDNGAINTSVASNGRGFYGWLPISIGGTTRWIQLYNNV